MNCSLFSSKRERIVQSGLFPFNCKQHQDWMIEKKNTHTRYSKMKKENKTNMNHDEMMKMREKINMIGGDGD